MHWVAPVLAIFRSRTSTDSTLRTVRSHESIEEDWIQVTPSELDSSVTGEVKQNTERRQTVLPLSGSEVLVDQRTCLNQPTLSAGFEHSQTIPREQIAATQPLDELSTSHRHHYLSVELCRQFWYAQEGCAETIYTIRSILRDLAATVDNNAEQLSVQAGSFERSRASLRSQMTELDEQIRILRSVQAEVSSLGIQASNTAHHGVSVRCDDSAIHSDPMESDDAVSTSSSSSSKAPSVIRDYISAARDVFLVKERIERLSASMRMNTRLQRSFPSDPLDGGELESHASGKTKMTELRNALSVAKDQEKAHIAKCVDHGYDLVNSRHPGPPRDRKQRPA